MMRLPRRKTVVIVVVSFGVIAVCGWLILDRLSTSGPSEDWYGATKGNMKQIYLAIEMYAEDNGGRLPVFEQEQDWIDALYPDYITAYHILYSWGNPSSRPSSKHDWGLSATDFELNPKLSGKSLAEIKASRRIPWILREKEPWHEVRVRAYVFADGLAIRGDHVIAHRTYDAAD